MASSSVAMASDPGDVSRKVMADLYSLVNSFSMSPTNGRSGGGAGSSPMTKMLNMFEKNLVDSSSVASNQSHDVNAMVLNKKVFVPLSILLWDSVSCMQRFLTQDTQIYQRMSTELLKLFAVHNVEYVDANGTKVKDSVFNREEVREASNRTLVHAATEIILYGYTVFAVKRDIIGSCTKESLWSDASNPSRATTGTHKIGGKAANRIPYSSAQDGSGILPYAHVDIDGGNLREYRNVEEGTIVFAYEPIRPDLKAMEKNFRFFVIVSPNKKMAPRGGGFQTGIGSVYQAWSRFRFALTKYQEAMSYLAAPIIYANYNADKINVANVTGSEIAINQLRLGHLSHDMSDQELEEKVVAISNGAVGPKTRKMVSSLLMRGGNLNKKVGALTEVRADVRNGMPGITNNGMSAGSMQAITSLEHDKYEYDRLDQSRIAGNTRGERMICMLPGVAVASVSQPVPNKDAVMLTYNFYQEQLSSLFSLLTQTTGISMGTGRSASVTSTQIEANEVEHKRSESEAMYIIKYLFHVVYVEWGAVLDQIGPIEVLTLLGESLRSIRAIGVLRDYIDVQATKNNINTDVMLAYLTEENTRRIVSLRTKAATNKSAAAALDSATRAEREVAVTIENFTKWDTVMRSYQGLSRLFAVVYRAMSASSDGNLFMEFKPTLMPTSGGSESGGSSALQPPAAAAFPAPGES